MLHMDVGCGGDCNLEQGFDVATQGTSGQAQLYVALVAAKERPDKYICKPITAGIAKEAD